ncbi:heavy metal translocating P-type ATPase [uncultured Mailhella sp.]|uniref:heavy metal translocating P-type ATPase n=1 Tax=uncultured Mailhella sp. TaxID=1981031 RepID=UPI00262C9AEF|nr:heavy metal translocating P-type ATPase [uncultured Mailhella sp.]
MKKEYYNVTGMSCAACSSRVQKAVSALAGVTDASVNLLKNSMAVTYDESALSGADIVAAVVKAGYGASPRDSDAGEKKRASAPDPAAEELRRMKTRLFVSLLFTLPLLYLSMGHMLGLPLPAFLLDERNAVAWAFTQFLLAVPVIAVNFTFYRVGFKTLAAGAPNMDSLIALGSGAAALSGVYAIYTLAFALGAGDMETVRRTAGNLYFESSAMILTLITLGKTLEARAKGKTSDAIARLMELAPPTATVVRGGEEYIVPLEQVAAGDVLAVKAGERVPVDGVVTEGHGMVDESALTGESLPQEKVPGDEVTGATTSTFGHFLMRATRVGSDTTLAQIVRLVDEASSSKAPISRLADRISGVFVPVVIAVAVAAAAVWLLLGHSFDFALSIAIAVLVISCPCALGLATPTAIMVGTGRGAAAGILLKSAEAIETAGSVDVVVLDKTGTVTEGKPAVTDVLPAPGVTEDELLTCAASLEKLSEHPLGAAVIREAERRGLALAAVTDFRQTPGRGISGICGGEACAVGNARMLSELKLESPLTARGTALAAAGKTPLFCIRKGALLGLVAVADVLKPTSRQAVAEWEGMGLDVVLLTGDNARTAQSVAREAGIRTVISDVLPQDKEREIRRLQEQGKKVVMVGDGINDAPALARADVGIAIGAGTDIAIESADIVLMKNDLLDAVAAIQLSRAVMRNIRENLFWAFFYNAVGIPVAAGALYSTFGLLLNPMIGAAAMSFSSVSVVSNALRLRFFQPKHLSPREGDAGASGESGKTAGAVPAKAPVPSATQKTRSLPMKSIVIEGMHCMHCSGAVEKALRAVPGVREVSVDLASKTATVEAEGVSDADLSKAVTDAGYEVVSVK